MNRFIQGGDRTQGILLPEQLDDYVTEENPVRVNDLFVDELDLATFGFAGVTPARTGRPAYHPADLLKNNLWKSESYPIKSKPGTRSPAQH